MEELPLDFNAQAREHILFSDLKPDIVERFFYHHKANPKIYELFKKFSWEIRRSGRDYYGAKSIVERIRWHTDVESKGDHFKIGNNYPACYARLLMIEDPSFLGFFRTRQTPGTVT